MILLLYGLIYDQTVKQSKRRKYQRLLRIRVLFFCENRVKNIILSFYLCRAIIFRKVGNFTNVENSRFLT